MVFSCTWLIGCELTLFSSIYKSNIGDCTVTFFKSVFDLAECNNNKRDEAVRKTDPGFDRLRGKCHDRPHHEARSDAEFGCCEQHVLSSAGCICHGRLELQTGLSACNSSHRPIYMRTYDIISDFSLISPKYI